MQAAKPSISPTTLLQSPTTLLLRSEDNIFELILLSQAWLGLRLKVLGYVKRAAQDVTNKQRWKGHPDSFGGAVFKGVWGYQRDRRQKLGGGCSSLQSLSAGSVALWMVNVGGEWEGVANERKGELGSPLFVAGIGREGVGLTLNASGRLTARPGRKLKGMGVHCSKE